MKKLEVKDALALIQAIQEGNGTAIMNGYKVKRKVYYIAGLGADLPGKNNQLIQQSTVKEIGVTNFDGGNKLNTGRSFMCVGLRLLFDTTASVAVKTATYLSAAPAAYKNGELKISQEPTGDLFDNPMGPFSKYNAAIATEDEFCSVVPFIIRPDVPFSIQMLLAGAVAADQAYKLELDGFEFVEANKG